MIARMGRMRPQSFAKTEDVSLTDIDVITDAVFCGLMFVTMWLIVKIIQMNPSLHAGTLGMPVTSRTMKPETPKTIIKTATIPAQKDMKGGGFVAIMENVLTRNILVMGMTIVEMVQMNKIVRSLHVSLGFVLSDARSRNTFEEKELPGRVD